MVTLEYACDVGVDSGQIAIVDSAFVGHDTTGVPLVRLVSGGKQFFDMDYPSGPVISTGGDGDFPVMLIRDDGELMGALVVFRDGENSVDLQIMKRAMTVSFSAQIDVAELVIKSGGKSTKETFIDLVLHHLREHMMEIMPDDE